MYRLTLQDGVVIKKNCLAQVLGTTGRVVSGSGGNLKLHIPEFSPLEMIEANGFPPLGYLVASRNKCVISAQTTGLKSVSRSSMEWIKSI